MRAWGDLPGDDPETATSARRREAAIEAAGIDLDPVPPGLHRHGDETHPSDHAHPHVHSGPGEPPIIGIVGAGAVGTALGVALTPGRLADPRGRQPRPGPARAVPLAGRGAPAPSPTRSRSSTRSS